ncbi:hypothetical protein BDP55DRAFT_650145 [Colletotrichum godetiae]|uniref:Uncharacterized protein n=1 Tax=Colletotrichum godetiae TaxID=1209918 RepID=A0AAJ0ATW6_9PEZI|nr:uncharacterized protein BDP55DRAFT_650145 [Colletotrichum godetiae]KAK1690277.1 hypothetical protein BDP55DRAFT_650145 [Colletotrichum godetiae]
MTSMFRDSDSFLSSAMLSLALSVVLFPHSSHTCHPFRRFKAAARKERERDRDQTEQTTLRSTLDEFLGNRETFCSGGL